MTEAISKAENPMTDREKKIAEIREWHEGKRDSFPQFTVFEAVGVMLDEIDRIEREYAEERAAHNAHVTELIEKEEECRKLRKELDLLQELAVKVTVEREKERKSAQQEIERLREENRKMIEGLRKLAKTNAENISEIREWKAKQNDPEVIDLDWYNYVARDILKEIGVNVE